jgi:hypothetical protein
MQTVTTVFLILLATFFGFTIQRPQPNPVGQWQRSEMIQPQELIIRVRDNGPSKPLIIFTGFMSLYRGGHIPGAVLGGPASTPAGLETLKHVLDRSSPNGFRHRIDSSRFGRKDGRFY